jgi:hypothetical protein
MCDAIFVLCVSVVQWDSGTRQSAEAKVRRAESGIALVVGRYGRSEGRGAKKGVKASTNAEGVVYWV